MDFTKVEEALRAAQSKAEELKVAISVAIVDDHGTLVAFSRMENALTVSPKFAVTKANTAAVLQMPTSAIGEYAQQGKPYFGINTLFGGELTPIPGGVPVKKGQVVVGGVGVGGSTDVMQDEQCAQAAAAVLGA